MALTSQRAAFFDVDNTLVTKAPLAPYGGTSPAMTEIVTECKKRGLMPFNNFNRIHVVPPCNVSEAEVLEGIKILDEALAVAGKYYEGKE